MYRRPSLRHDQRRLSRAQALRPHTVAFGLRCVGWRSPSTCTVRSQGRSAQPMETVPFAEYSKLFPKPFCQKGVLEVMAQRTTIHYTSDMDGEFPQMHTRDIICPPCVLQSARASTIHNAIELHGGLSTEQIKLILGVRRFCIIGDTPDNASSMVRRQRHVAEQLDDSNGALFIPLGCFAHKLHRIVDTEDKTVMGDVYSIGFALFSPSHKNRIHKAVLQLIDEVEIISAPPDPSWESHHSNISRIRCEESKIMPKAHTAKMDWCSLAALLRCWTHRKLWSTPT